MKDSRYRGKSYIGSGGMASVYKAFDQTLERDVAIKEMAEQLRGNADVLDLFLREARKMASVRHINVVQVYDIIEGGEVPTIIMEFMGGGSLASRLGPGRLPEEEVLDVLQQVVAGLSAIHDAGLVHRDIKPENILEEKGVYKITDFGVAMSGDEDTLPFVTSKYAAPEVLVAPEQIGPRSDLYSLGIMAMELLLGPRRFAEVVRDAIEGQQQAQLPAIKDSTQAFWQQWVASSAELPPLNDVDSSVSPAMGTLLKDLTRRDQTARIRDSATLLGRLADLMRHDRQRVLAPTEYEPKIKRRVEAAKKGSTAPAVATKRKSPLWFKAVIGFGALLFVGIAALMLMPDPTVARFRLEVVTDPPGASLAVNGTQVEGGVTPVSLDASYGDVLVLRVDGIEPTQVVLSEGMEGLSTTDQGLRLHAVLPVPTGIATSAAAAAMLSEHLPRSWTLGATLKGAAADGTPRVAVGSPLVFSVTSERPGTLLMAHLGADDTLSLIYPSPGGASPKVTDSKSTSVGADIGLVANEPTGLEWLVFLVSAEPLSPPEIAGREVVEGKVTRYAFGPGESAGGEFIRWLVDSFEKADVASAIVPIEVVREAN